MRVTTPAEVRAAIASHVLGKRIPERLGDITLHAHQVAAVRRLQRMIDAHGGALLADDVGLGKSYVALALARSARSPVLVAPAATRATWQSACQRAAVGLPFFSIESLARRVPDGAYDLVIVDEAHHLRNPATLRFASAARLTQRCPVVLLTATPVQNSLNDLRALLSLFLGQRAFGLSLDELGVYCLKRDTTDVPRELLRLPAMQPPVWLPEAVDVECLERILALPPPLPPLDGGDGGILLSYTLVRQWSSSRAALRGALRRRLLAAAALEASLSAGRHPTREELRGWSSGDDAMQLAFPELMASMAIADAPALIAQSQRYGDAVRELLGWLQDAADPDLRRAEIIEGVVRHHAGERIVVFSQYADTVHRFFRLLAGRVRSAMLTHRGGRVAGGAITRRELLARFDASAPSAEKDSDRIDLLLTTDVLSEGVNLHAASVVIHADLAWNPARLQQRVGRLRRIGAARDTVHVYLFPPPRATDRLLRMEQLLRRKLGLTAMAVGASDTVLPDDTLRGHAPLRHYTRITQILASWQQGDGDEDLVVAALEGTTIADTCALVCVRLEGTVELLAVHLPSGVVSRDAEDVAALLAQASTGTATLAPELSALLEIVAQYCRGRSMSAIVTLPAMHAARSRRTTLRRVHTIASKASRSTQARQLPLVSRARGTVAGTLTAGAERALASLTRSSLPDHELLHSLATLAPRPRRAETEILAVLLLRP